MIYRSHLKGDDRGPVEVLAQYLPEGTKEIHKNDVIDDFAEFEYKNRALTYQPFRLISRLIRIKRRKRGGGGGR
jgi:hypothetical protein